MADLKIGTAAYDEVLARGGTTVEALFAAAVAWNVPVVDAMNNLLSGGALKLNQYRAEKQMFLRFDRT